MKFIKSTFVSILVLSLGVSAIAGEEYSPKIDSKARLIKFKEDAFKPDPNYPEFKYDPNKQLEIYGGKYANDPPWYLHLFGRRLYPLGPFKEGWTLLGKKNLIRPMAMAFGDVRLTHALSDNGVDEKSEIAARANLDIDLMLTDVERLHAFVRPFDKDGQFTRFTSGDDFRDNGKFEGEFDFNLDALFFEGDVGSLMSGFTGKWSRIDLPFAVGFMPILFHNGIWFNDNLIGAAFTFPAKNSRTLDISNMDFTFFTANDEINSAISSDVNDVKLHGTNIFIEALDGYFEIGYAFTENELNSNLSYHNMALSWTTRWKNWASLSYRVIHNFGQDDSDALNPVPAANKADGTLLLFESSLITHKPYTLVPYLNMFAGIDSTRPAARAAGGILQNVGIMFEGDGITSFPTLDANGLDTWGGSLGIEYLFNLDQQIVLEASYLDVMGGDGQRVGFNVGQDYGFGLRYQRPLNDTVIFRVDGIWADREEREDIYGFRTELRWKF